MTLETLVALARENGASDLHLEGGLPAALRIRGELKSVGEPIPASALKAMARDLLGQAWPEFVEQRSADLSRTLRGVRCRINVLHSARGVGFAIRLLSGAQATLRKLNLHPDLRRFASEPHGLILVSGPTGSGKSSTLSALLEEINLSEARHIVTLESPIEYALTPKRAFVRQREVGRDTPSFERGLVDALREDPDVLMVGEMRDPETLRLTLNAAETGHLVLSTVHSASCAEALNRVVSAFAPEAQPAVRSQLADSLVAVICQRLRYRDDLGIRVPECEILVATSGVRSVVRRGEMFKIASALESGGAEGNWTFARYSAWLEKKTDWHLPEEPPPGPAHDPEPLDEPERSPASEARKPASSSSRKPAPAKARKPVASEEGPQEPGVLVISDPDEDPESILRELPE